MGQRVGGTSYVKVDGVQMVISGNIEAPLGKFNRETITKGHYKEEEVVPFLSGEYVIPKGLDTDKITKGTNMTITTEFANGKVYTLSGAYVVGDANVGSDEGKASIRFEGDEGDWS